MGGEAHAKRLAAIRQAEYEKEQRPIIAEKRKRKLNRRRAIFIGMKNHENFVMPVKPRKMTKKGAAEYAINCAVALISPKQIAGESNDFECVDIIDILENELLPDILKELS